MATCLNSDLSVTKSLELSLRTLKAGANDGAVETLQAIESGESLTTALFEIRPAFPRFYLAILQAGEQTGQLVESLRFLEHHTAMLAGPARAVRNVWLYPLVIIVCGSLVKLLAFLFLAPFAAAVSFFSHQLRDYFVAGVAIGVWWLPQLRPYIDRIKLHVPWIGTVQRELARQRFFQVLALAYAVSGQRVEQMIRLAISTVGNRALRDKLEQVAIGIEEGQTIPEACQRCPLFTRSDMELLHVGDLAGTLEDSCQRISQMVGEQLEQRLQTMQRFLMRLAGFLVILSISSTIISLASFIRA